MKDLETYVYTHLKDELDIIRRDFQHVLPELPDEAKTIIYKYTDDDDTFNESINTVLRNSKGLVENEFSTHLNTALNKLPNLKELVYRGTVLSRFDIERYQNALENKTILIEHSFLSASLSEGIARANGDILFKIFGKTCKLIEKVSKFGSQSVYNEQEVLFQQGTSFRVLDISKQGNYIIIILREV
jgi:NAD:arginine ADP-ribosyltransferase